MATTEKSKVFRNENDELKQVQQKVLAEVLGITSATVNNHKDIFVRTPGTKRGQYDLPLSVQAYLKAKTGQDGSVQGETHSKRGRHIDQQTRKLEIENRVRVGELIERSDASAVVNDLASGVRAGLTALPGRLATLVAAKSRPAECRALIDAEVSELLGAIEAVLSTSFERGASSDTTSGTPDTETSTEEKPKRVGGRKPRTTKGKRGTGKVAK